MNLLWEVVFVFTGLFGWVVFIGTSCAMAIVMFRGEYLAPELILSIFVGLFLLMVSRAIRRLKHINESQ